MLLTQLAIAICATQLVWAVLLVVYRLFVHPLAKIPGPKFAAATSWYEAYYDIVQRGKYVFEVQELHEQYGNM